ncbi:hypothetical protein Poli38472_008945 [Pythium oligandrum]|uniref:Alcohol dehydrogenase n=1 Tax=Pythium oligandrum TaxID=41045 RepID=A0A8K1FE60_PYTOL|nr:hypothetical protein Poli38472_008945 [Pythium oligandrum]|eukprot:TMW56297.1 hypothetical protein Poli38472_008945 [Pythium oligandrum]
MEFMKRFTGGSQEEKLGPAPQGQMKAVVWHGGKSIKVEYVPKPKIQDGADLIVRVTASSIAPGFCTQVCAGDIPGMEKGQILGREAVGIVDQVGPEIVKFKKGDRVVISFIIACGECSFCRRREFSACNRTNESKEFAQMYGGWAPAAMFGGSRLHGNVPGSQAEFVRVPFGDANCYKIPDSIPDEKALFAADTAASALHATELGQVIKGDTVVIWGLGPVGLLTAKWAKMKGAKRIIGVDLVHERLKAAYDKFDLEVVDRTGLSTAEVTKKLLDMLPDGGADVTIDACGCSAAQSWMKKMEKAVGVEKESADLLKEIMTVARKCGHVGVIADYNAQTDGFPIGHIMMKHLTLRAGQTPVQKYFKEVLDAIDAGELDPTMLITHHMALDDAAAAYQHACKKDEGFLKVLIRPSAEQTPVHAEL